MHADLPQASYEPIPAAPAVAGKRGQIPSLRRRVIQQVLQAFVIMALAFACYYFISNYLLQSVRVVGSSMAPTLHDSDSYLLNRWVYWLRGPQRSDIIVLRDPVDGLCSVKRVVAVSGDTVYIKNGLIYVNGHELHEPYLVHGTFTFGERNEELFRCGKDQYFVLGDNRNNSVDSRSYGPVPREKVLGLIVK